MCTCITYQDSNFYFGRNLDLECSFGEQVVITPRHHPFFFLHEKEQATHYAMIGMATVLENRPLYAEAVNEKGLCIAGLYFPEYGRYQSVQEGKINLATFELIPWLLGQFATVEEAEPFLRQVNLTQETFGEQMPLVPMHWMVADRRRCLVLEPMEEGLQIHENPLGVLTNSPPYGYHRINLNNYMNLSSHAPENHFSNAIPLKPYGQGMGALGLPGDVSPSSRFVRAAFLKFNAAPFSEETASVTQFFHILSGVSVVKGTATTPQGMQDYTTYSCCCNVDQGVFYYRTYDNSRIHGVRLWEENLDRTDLIRYPLPQTQEIAYDNQNH